MKSLFDTTKMRTHALRNRAWRSATWLGLADEEGFVTDAIVDTYEKLAEGGVAMIVTGLTSISAKDARIGGECKFYDDRFVADHRRLTDAVHRHDSRILLQTAMVDGPVDELLPADDDVDRAAGADGEVDIRVGRDARHAVDPCLARARAKGAGAREKERQE